MGIEDQRQFEQVFTTDSFSEFKPIWSTLFERFKPKTILEIGSFEGRSACFTIEEATRHGDVELHCMDSFAGSFEHRHEGLDLGHLEARFDANVKISLDRIEGRGSRVEGRGSRVEAGAASSSIRRYPFPGCRSW